MMSVVAAAFVFSGCSKEDDEAYNYVLDGESALTGDLASDPYGANLYDGSYTGFYDAVSDLAMYMSVEDYFFSNGGIAVSRFNDTVTEGYLNQCSVYYKDARTGKGGHNGSNTFFVSYGNNSSYMDSRTSVYFRDVNTTCLFDHFWVNNTTYAALSMLKGDGYTEPMSYEKGSWFKLIIEGMDREDHVVGKVEFYLADFRTATAPGVVTEWTKVDLRGLGEVYKLRFNLESSEQNAYGMATPAYFCFDDLAVKL